MPKKKIQSARAVTFDLLRHRPASITLKQVAEETGLSLPWVKLFHLRGNKCSASIDKVETLYKYLSGKSFV